MKPQNSSLVAARLLDGEQRFKRVGTCSECSGCSTKTTCLPVKQKLKDDYDGIRFTADGFDCALPVSIDSHTMCAYSCLYCFSENLGGHKAAGEAHVRQYNLNALEGILSGEHQNKQAHAIRMALKRDPITGAVSGQPCPVQLGALTDPFDNIERNQGWALKLPALLSKYNQPCRISTKGSLFHLPEYLAAFARPDLFWVAFSIISIDDELIAKVDKFAPVASERIKAMKALSSRGVKTSLRFRPIIPNLSDRTPKHPKAYKDLIERCAEAGASAVSMEALFTPGLKKGPAALRWDTLEKEIGYPIRETYKDLTVKGGACTRLSREYVEDIFYACQEITHKCGMTFAVSDPLFKHLNDTGCCCGITEDDPVFGNWQRENATTAVVEAKRTGQTVTAEQFIPAWSHLVNLRSMCCIVGPHGKSMEDTTWGHKLRNTWNDLKSNRGVLYYFQGALRPVGKNEKGDIVYAYSDVARSHFKNQIFKV